jgi:hypothetical protein
LAGAQTLDSMAWRQEKNTLMEQYLDEARNQALIYTGKEPQPYAPHITNHPYFKSGLFTGGVLSYDGIRYPNVTLMFDSYRDQLIVLSPGTHSHLILQSNKVDYAEMFGYRVIYFSPDGLKNSPSEGYYLLLYDGKCKVLEKQSCSLFETRKNEVREGYFNKSSKYYVLKDGVYHMVKSKGSVLKIFEPHKRELNQYSRQQQLNFRKETGNAIISIVKQYETFIQQQ